MDVGPEKATAEASDLELLRAFRAGSTAAFEELYRRKCGPLYIYARALVRDDGAAEDLVHETFLRLVRTKALPVAEDLTPFLSTVLRRLVVDRARSEGASRRRERAVQGRWIRGADPAIDPGLVGALNDALPLLPPEQLEVILLHVYSGLTFQNVANVVGAPLKTVISRYGYALGKLAELLGEDR